MTFVLFFLFLKTPIRILLELLKLRHWSAAQHEKLQESLLKFRARHPIFYVSEICF